MFIELSPVEMERCAVWGNQRTEENKNRSDRLQYDKNRFGLTSLQANRLGLMVEYAVYKWAGFDPENIDLNVWCPFTEQENYNKYLKQADIAGVIEVKRADKPWSPIPVHPKDVKEGVIVVQGYINYTQNGDRFSAISVPPVVELFGWADIAKDYPNGAIPNWDPSGRSRTLSRRPMDTLDLDGYMGVAVNG